MALEITTETKYKEAVNEAREQHNARTKIDNPRPYETRMTTHAGGIILARCVYQQSGRHLNLATCEVDFATLELIRKDC